jgi:sugar (pentulose or hexulose) kinase
MNLYVGVDIGTSGVRAVAIDTQGRVSARACAPMPKPMRDGLTVVQAPQLWWNCVQGTLGQLLAIVDAQAVRSIAFAGTSGTLLLTDAQGMPLAPALMYNDASCVEAIGLIDQHAPANSGARGTGSSLARMLHLQEQHPAARHALHQADWVAGRMCARYGLSDYNNSLKLGYDTRAMCWPVWMRRVGTRMDLLPDIVAPGSAMARIDPSVAKNLGLACDVQIVAGTTDSIAAFISTGADAPGDAVTSLGSTLVLKVISDTDIWASEYGVYSHKLGNRWLVGGASNSGGASLLQFFDEPTMREMTPSLTPDQATGLNYYPLPHVGERFPLNDPTMHSRIEPRPGSDVTFFQGLLEGIAEIEHQGYKRLEALGALFPTNVRSLGGGSANTAWQRIRERKLRVPMHPPTSGSAAHGAALLSRKGAING